MTFVPVGPGQNTAYKVTIRLRQRYSEWTADLTEQPRIPYLRWTDDGARAAYQLICTLNSIPMEA